MHFFGENLRRTLPWASAAVLPLALSGCSGDGGVAGVLMGPPSCDEVKETSVARFTDLSSGLVRESDPGGDTYDVTLNIPAKALEMGFERMMRLGKIKTELVSQEQIGVPGLRAMGLELVADVQNVSFDPVEADPSSTQAHVELRIRGTLLNRKVFAVYAKADGLVEVAADTQDDGVPAVFVRMGDLRDAEVQLKGEFLGARLITVIEGVLPKGGWLDVVKNFIGKKTGIRIPKGELPDAVEELIIEVVRAHIANTAQRLVTEQLGDVKVLELGQVRLLGLELTPTALGLTTHDGSVTLGLRTNLDSGFGELRLADGQGASSDQLRVKVGEAVLQSAVKKAYADDVVPRLFDAQGDPVDVPDHAVYAAEPLGLDLDASPRLSARLYRLEDPCGWADLGASLTVAATGSTVDFTVADVSAEKSKGAGNLVNLILENRERLVGRELSFAGSIPTAVTPRIAGMDTVLTVESVQPQADHLVLDLGYELPALELTRDVAKLDEDETEWLDVESDSLEDSTEWETISTDDASATEEAATKSVPVLDEAEAEAQAQGQTQGVPEEEAPAVQEVDDADGDENDGDENE